MATLAGFDALSSDDEAPAAVAQAEFVPLPPPPQQASRGCLPRAAVGRASHVPNCSTFEDVPCSPMDPNARELQCVICDRKSTECRWHVVITVQKTNGVGNSSSFSLMMRPDGDLCFLHGAGVAAYPLLSVEQVVQKVGSDAHFREEFFLVCERVAAVGERLFQQMSVSTGSAVSGETYLEVAAIPSYSVTSTWMPVGTLKLASARTPMDAHINNTDSKLLHGAGLGKTVLSMDTLKEAYGEAQRRLQSASNTAESVGVAAREDGGATVQRIVGGVATTLVAGPSEVVPRRGRAGLALLAPGQVPGRG